MNIKEINRILEGVGVDRTASAKDALGTWHVYPHLILNQDELRPAASVLVFAPISGCGYDYNAQGSVYQVYGSRPPCPLCGEMSQPFRLYHSPNKCGCRNCGHEWEDENFCKPYFRR